jgi:hypothetical protein
MEWVLGEADSQPEWKRLYQSVRRVVGKDAPLGMRVQFNPAGDGPRWKGALFTTCEETAAAWQQVRSGRQHRAA